MDTICAISTAVGNGGVAVIRISGSRALEVGGEVFKKLKNNPRPRYAIFGELEFDLVKDNALALYFPEPHSFTGENVVELQIHGGYYLAQSLINYLTTHGARLAERGEFSRRAVLNGKIDMTEAEGIIDLINANSMSQLRAGSSLLNGAMTDFVVKLQQELTDLMCEVNVALDYPEHDIEYITAQKISQKCEEINKKISQKLATSSTGMLVKNGVNVVLAGKPNAGKSSLFNALLGYDRAIVTNIAGTTRDAVSDSYEYNGVRFILTDTAGLRATNDVVEGEGVSRAKKEIVRADVVLHLIDATNPDEETLDNQNTIRVLNKIDLNSAHNASCDTQISAKTGAGVYELKQLIFDRTINSEVLLGGDYLTNARHIECLRSASDALLATIKNCDTATLDCLAVTLMQAWNKLGEITGETANEKIMDEIFSRFCLGK